MKKQVFRGPSERLKVGSGISEQRLKVFTLISVDEPCTSKEVMRRSRTTRDKTLENAALFSFSLAVPDEIYGLSDHELSAGTAPLGGG